MMYDFNGNFINAAEIVSVSSRDSGNPTYPFQLVVTLKSGGQFAVNYKDKFSRTKEAQQIARFHDNTCPDPVSRWELQSLLDSQTAKLLRYIREIRKLVMEGFSHEQR